jgi:ribokinase
MKSGNVDLRWKVIEEHHTGMAYIYVDSKGENSIVIFGGTNMEFENKDDIDDDFKKVIDQSHYLLLQKEIPMSINLAAAKYAHSQSKIVILDCGGRDDDIPEELLDNITYISPNETELLRLDETIIGRTELEPLAEEIRKKLIERHPNLRVLLKLGSKGSAVITKDVVVRGDVVTSINKDILNDYKIIDTVGAGDCFTGAYAVRHSELNWSDISL